MTPLSLVNTESDVLTMRSDLLGELTLQPSDIFTFPQGILGFPECRRFALLRGAHDGLFWLQSMEYSALAFLLVDPFSVVRNYVVDLPPSQFAEIGVAEDPSDIALLVTVTLPSATGDLPTVNLQGPLAINFRTRRAKQIVVTEGEYGVRTPVDLTELVA
jgi:flagellar assembly factor FliW